METQNGNYTQNEEVLSHDTAVDKSDILGGPSAEDIEGSTTDDGNIGYADVEELLDQTANGPEDEDDDLDDDSDLDLDEEDPDEIIDDEDIIDNDLNTDDDDLGLDDDDENLL